MTTATSEAPAVTPRRAGWTLALLTLVYFFYLLDRNAIVVTQELVKREFGLSDTEVGFVIGTVYGVSYGLAALPIGWMIDRGNRRNILAGILAVWSGLTAMCGVSSAYWQLLAARIGVAASEAGGSPASLSILSDMYPPARRSTVASIFYAGSGLGICVSFFAGGLIAQEFGWRAVFLVYGLPGLLLALAIALTVREPARTAPAAGAPPPSGFLRGVGALVADPVLARLYLAATLYCLSTAAVLGWIVAFLMRERGLDVATAGMIVAATVGGGSIVGGVLTGLLADRARRRRRDGALRVVAAAAAVNLAAGIVAVEAGSLAVCVAALFVYGMTVFAYPGPTNAVISEVAPAYRRGTAFALYALLANLIGGGLGPLAVGLLSDGWFGGELGPVLELLIAVNMLTALAYLLAGRRLRRLTEDARSFRHEP